MPPYRKLPFQRTLERRSLRVPCNPALRSMLLPLAMLSAKNVLGKQTLQESFEGHHHPALPSSMMLRRSSSSAFSRRNDASPLLQATPTTATLGMASKGPAKPKLHRVQTPLDLELDLAAQQAKLKMLQDEIDRLKLIKAKLEDARHKGERELPSWLQEEERFHAMLAKVRKWRPGGATVKAKRNGQG